MRSGWWIRNWRRRGKNYSRCKPLIWILFSLIQWHPAGSSGASRMLQPSQAHPRNLDTDIESTLVCLQKRAGVLQSRLCSPFLVLASAHGAIDALVILGLIVQIIINMWRCVSLLFSHSINYLHALSILGLGLFAEMSHPEDKCNVIGLLCNNKNAVYYFIVCICTSMFCLVLFQTDFATYDYSFYIQLVHLWAWLNTLA